MGVAAHCNKPLRNMRLICTALLLTLIGISYSLPVDIQLDSEVSAVLCKDDDSVTYNSKGPCKSGARGCNGSCPNLRKRLASGIDVSKNCAKSAGKYCRLTCKKCSAPKPKPIIKPTVCPSAADICSGKAKCEGKCPCPKCMPPKRPPVCKCPVCPLEQYDEEAEMLQLGNGCSCVPCKTIIKPTVCPSIADICSGKAKCEGKCPCPMCTKPTPPKRDCNNEFFKCASSPPYNVRKCMQEKAKCMKA